VTVDRLERLLNLVSALLDTDRLLTADDIRLHVPGYPEQAGAAFHRAFERDKSALRDMGIPLDVVALDPTRPDSEIGYRVRRDRYELPDPGLTAEEVAALHFAATQVRLEGSDVTEAVWKLGGVPGVEAEPADGAARAAIPGSTYLPVLFGAATERRAVHFTYRGEARVVDPWRLEFRNAAWYLIGRDHGRDERRTFRLERVTGDVEVGPPDSFEPPPEPGGVATHPWEMGDEEPVVVDVLVDAEQAAWAVANAGGTGAWRDDGSVVLTLRVTNRAALRSWVLGFLDHAEIQSPASEREALAAWIAPWAAAAQR
jgi:proteasome accessory factor B